MQKIVPHLWFDTEAREAAEFYRGVFPGSEISSVTTLTDTPSGDCDVVSFSLCSYEFMAISAGPLFRINPSPPERSLGYNPRLLLQNLGEVGHPPLGNLLFSHVPSMHRTPEATAQRNTPTSWAGWSFGSLGGRAWG